MSSEKKAFVGADVFDGSKIHKQAALLVHSNTVLDVTAERDIPSDVQVERLNGGLLCPGFVDLQVNGGGGLMFNDKPDLETLEVMAAAHRKIGATSILPTLITDTKEQTNKAINAVVESIAAGIPGIEGLHLEGPHLSLAKKGAHDGNLIRPMSDDDLAILLHAKAKLPVLKVTVAPENVSFDQIQKLAEAGVLVSLGHTDVTFETCRQAVSAGAKCVTHLFNAQSQLGSREPGVVGAALELGALSAGLIADGIHVHPKSMQLALAAKSGPGQIFLVSDSMATAGSDIQSFKLNGRAIKRDKNRLTLVDGTLAGAHLELSTAVKNLVEFCGAAPEKALAMATSIPADLIGLGNEIGCFKPGARANVVHLSEEFDLQAVF